MCSFAINKKQSDSNSGSVLFLAIVITVILMLLGYAYIYISQEEMLFFLRSKRRSEAFSAAEAGLERAKGWLLMVSPSPEWHAKNVLDDGWVEGKTFEPFVGPDTDEGWNTIAGSEKAYAVSISPDEGNMQEIVRYYTIYSTGRVTSPHREYYKPLTAGVTVYMTRVPGTGQETADFNDPEDTPPGSDDKYYYPPRAELMNNADGTITDVASGLMWPRDWEGEACLYGSSSGWGEALDYGRNLDFADYTDWRLPDIKELTALVSYGRYDPAVVQDIDSFTGVGSQRYWVSEARSLSFDGDNEEYVELPHFGEGVDFSQITASAWVYPTGGGTLPGILLGRGDTLHWEIRDNKWRVRLGNLDWNGVVDGPPLYTWTHVAFVYNRAVQVLAFYQNGEEKYREVYDDSGTSSFFTSGDLPRIGSSLVDGRFWYGLIDDVRIFNQALTGQAIRDTMYKELRGDVPGLVGYWRFNKGAGSLAYDSTANNNHGTIEDAAWSGNVPDVSPALAVNMDDGAVEEYSESSLRFAVVRRMRQDEYDYTFYSRRPANFRDNGDGTVTDTRTGLMWMRDPSSMEEDSARWDDAIAYCEELEYPEEGYTDWRLPDKKELLSIVNYSNAHPAEYPGFSVYEDYYWTSTTDIQEQSEAWAVDFTDGSSQSRSKAVTGLIRPVRGPNVEREYWRERPPEVK